MENNPSDWFDTTFLIHQVAKASGHSEGDAKLFAYIHIKSHEVGWLKFLEGRHETTALRVLLGDDVELDSFPEPLKKKLAKLNEMVKQVDFNITQETGMEFVLGAEIRNRLRFHEDEEFKAKYLKLYFEDILTEVNEEYGMLAAG